MATLVIASFLSLFIAWPSAANFGGVFPTDEEFGTAIETISTNQNLFAYALTDVQGGDICIKPAALENPGDGTLDCRTPAWGSSNRVMGIGSTWTLIQTPYLRAGHWKLLGDGGSNQSVDVFSNDFWVLPCEPGACSREIAMETAQRYKNAAAEMAASMRGISWTVHILDQVAPREPFEYVNVINQALKVKLEDDPLFKRVIADKVTRKLQFATRLPTGPHGMALAIAKQVSADALEMYLDIVNDPPAPYDTVAQPEFDVPALSTGDAEIDGLMLDLAQLAGYGAAGRKAFERYQQAAADDSDAGVHRQAAAMGRFDARLAEEMWSSAVGLDRWADKIDEDPDYGGAIVTQEQVDEVRAIAARVRSTGLTAEERQGFAAEGMSEEAIDALEDILGVDELDSAVVGVPIGQLLREAAAELREQTPAFDEIGREAEAVAQTTDTPPVASFEATPASGAPPLEVTFRDTSTHPDDEPLTISWDFGDGTPAADGAQVTHTFNAGSHVVTQTVSDGVSTSTATRTIVATPPNGAPTAHISRTPGEGEAPLSVNFDGSASSDDGTVVAYDWAFGDGAAAEGPAAEHVYETPGSYTATLTVTDDQGSTGTAVATVIVREPPPPGPPVANPDALTTRQDTARTIDVLANDRDPEGGPLKVVDTGAPAHGTASCTEEGSCTYTPDPGYHGADAFTYVVEDDTGQRATGEVTVTVNPGNSAPLADAGPDIDIFEADSANLDASGSSDLDGTIAGYTWDPGDGSEPATAESPVMTHSYGRPGTYTARVVVTDDAGATAEDETIVRVANRPPTVDAGPYPRAPLGTTRPYVARVSTGPTEPSTVQVDFGDGSAAAEQEFTGFATPSFDHAYADAGTYHMTFTVTDSAGETATTEQTVLVEDAVAAAGPDVSADEGATVTLGGASTPPDEHTSVRWDFGDGSAPGTGVEAEHVYRDDGVYTARVTVEDDVHTVSDEVRVTVANVDPEPGLTLQGGAQAGSPVAMRGFARDPGAEDVLSFTWTFGDGTTGTGRRVAHTYMAAGTYPVSVRVDDGDGGTAVAEGNLVVGGPGGRRDNRGKDFWLSFPTNYVETPALTLFIAAETATTGRVEVPGLGWSRPFAVTPGAATAVELPPDAQLDSAIAGPQDRGVHVSSAADVSVYGLNRIKFTTDAFLGLPTDALGTDYRVISYGALGGAGPEASVVAAAGDTTVTITPTGAVKDHPAGEPYSVELEWGEAYQLVSEGDLTGTRIVADRPVAAFGAHTCAQVPVGVPYCDHLVEQLTPVDTWGRRFATMPFATRTGGDTFRILASEPGTTVKINDQQVATLAAGVFHEQLVTGPATIEAGKPVLVTQYSNGSSFDSTVSDPFMTIVTPSEQFQAAYTVSTPLEGFAVNFLNLVVPQAAKGTVVLDGESVPASSFTTIGTSGFVGAQIEVELGSHRVSSTAPFGVTVYGYDADDSYGYGGGMALAEVASVTQLQLTPATETLDKGTEGCVVATGLDAAGVPVPDVRVDFAVAGPNAGSGFAPTGAGGAARFCWRGASTGEDAVTASIGALSRSALKRWRDPAPPGDPVGASEPGPTVKQEEPKQEVKGESSASDLVLGCTERMVVLEDVVPAGSKVRLVGVADRRFAGKTVSIVFVPSGKAVARPKVAADGSFSAMAPMPPKRLRDSNLARYEARIGSQRSLKLKLARRMRITTIGASGGKVVVTGTVVGPLAARKADRVVELQRRVSCTSATSVAKVMPRPDGTFRIAVDVPAGESAAVYRLRTKVRQSAKSPRAVNTFTLPRGVNF